MDLRSSRPDRAASKYASTMPIPPNSYTSPVHRGEYADSVGRGSRSGYDGWSPYDGRRSATATMTAFSDGGRSGEEEEHGWEDEEPSWYRRREVDGQQQRRRRGFEPRSYYPEYDYYDARHRRPLSSLFDEIVEGARNRLRGRSARPRRPEPYQPSVHDNGDNVPNDVEQIAAPIPQRPSVARPPSRSTTVINNGSARGSRPPSAASLQRPEPTPIQPVEPVIPTKFSPSPPSPPPLGPLASFTTFLRALRALPMITPNSFSSRGERAPFTLTYTPATSSDRSFAQMSKARRKGMIRYGRRGEWEGEVEKGESWYVMSGAQEARAARRAMSRSIRAQEKERKRAAKEEIDNGIGQRTGHHRSNTISSMAYSYSHGPQAIPPPRLASSSTTSRTHERRPTVSSQHRRVASPPPSYQTHTMVTPTPYGAVPVSYAPYIGYPAYGYPVYASQPLAQKQRQYSQPQATVPVVPPSTAQPERRLSGSSGRSQRSRVSSRRSRARSRHGSDEGSIVPIPPEELPSDVKAAVSIEALN